ncbi:MAG: DUF58 domain-containing protein [Solirubrobacterales bacterium]|nr:DUF58 domain-containing protein [Solirubrobacterales bacterium]
MRSTRFAVSLGLALCLAAAGFAATPLYVPGVALLLTAIVAAVWVKSAARGLRLRRSVGATVVEEQTPLPITVRLSRGRLPLPSAELRVWPDGPPLPVPGPSQGKMTSAVRFPRRGRQLLGPASVVVGDPIGLCSRIVASAASEVLVLPRVEPIHLLEVEGEPAIFGRAPISAPDAGATEVDSLRPYRDGSPASRIHWPTVARTTTLMERRLVADGERTPWVLVDPRHPASADALDRAMRAAASLCVHLARRGGCALLLPGDRQPTRIGPTLSGFSESHARLALMVPEAGAPPVGRLTSLGAVLWVTAAAGMSTHFAQLRAPLRYLVSPHPRPGVPVQFTVAGCSGQRLESGAVRRRAA